MARAPSAGRSSTEVRSAIDASFGPFEWAEHCSSATTAADEITCFSDSNATLDLLAPGALITSDGLGGGRSTYMGTSQASPHAAGAAAVLLSIEPELAAAAVEALLKTTGKRIVDPRNGVTVPRVDLLAATQSLLASRTSAKHHRAVKP